MANPSRAPSFPPPTLVERALELGFGSGPWTRTELERRWGDSLANKFIQDGKDAGWIVSPFRDTFYVPPAQDLMVVGWLSGLARQEFIISRQLIAAGFRCWCLSSWARTQNLDFNQPLFVTDLAPVPPIGPRKRDEFETEPPPVAELKRRNRDRAATLRRLPFLDDLIMVPELPQTSRLGSPTYTLLPRGIPSKIPSATWLTDESPLEASLPKLQMGAGRAQMAAVDSRRIRYSLTAPVDDPAWIAALLAALNLPRVWETLPRIAKRLQGLEQMRERPTKDFFKRVQGWASIFGPPESNEGWSKVLANERYPYLLVPTKLWSEVSSTAASQRFEELLKLARVSNVNA